MKRKRQGRGRPRPRLTNLRPANNRGRGRPRPFMNWPCMGAMRRIYPQQSFCSGVFNSANYIGTMKHGEKMLICTVAGLALCTAANAVTSESSGSPYLGIVERNVFGLKPPPPPPDPEASKPPPPRIFLQGITTFGGVKRALFKAQMPPKAGEPPKGEQSFILAEGQRDGDMEVVAIDANPPGSVKVSAFSTIITLDFEHNGIKMTAAAPVPGGPPRLGVGVPPPGAPGANPFTPTGGTQPFNSTSAQAQGATAAARPQMSAEQRFLMVEAYRAKLKQQGLGRTMSPIPPTPPTQELNPSTSPAAQ
jgi:hypothetical protein